MIVFDETMKLHLKTIMYKLTYWEGSGLGVPVRLAFYLGDIDFDDVRIVNEADWPAIKAATPLGQVPILEFGNKVFTQSNALLRYVAGKANLSEGASLLDNLVIDEVCGIIDDTSAAIPRDSTFENLKVAREQWMSTKVQQNMSRVEEYIQKSDSGFISPTGISIADLKLYGFFTLIACGYFDHISTNLADRFPNITKVLTNVRNHQKLSKYFERNPGEEAQFTTSR